MPRSKQHIIQARNLVASHVGILMPQKLGDVGCDLVVSEKTIVPRSAAMLVPCGVAVKLPRGCWGLVAGRSSAVTKHGLLVVWSVIDEGYTGPLFAHVLNISGHAVCLVKGDRVAQLVLVPAIRPAIRHVRALPQTKRGETGFGSTDKRKPESGS